MSNTIWTPNSLILCIANPILIARSIHIGEIRETIDDSVETMRSGSDCSLGENQQFSRETSLKSPLRRTEKCH